MRKILNPRKIRIEFFTFVLLLVSIIGTIKFPGITKEAEASEPVQASFCIVDEDKFWASYPNIDTSAVTFVGEGKISYSCTIIKDETATKNSIISAPESSVNNWAYVGKIYGKYYVAAVAPKEAATPAENPVEEVKPEATAEAPKTAAPAETKTEAPAAKEETTASKSNTVASAKAAAPAKSTAPKETVTAETKTEAEKAEETNSEPTTHVLNRQQILSANSSSFPAQDSVKWDEYNQSSRDKADGVIPVKLLDDPVYTSMNLPSETRSTYMEEAVRDNGHFYDDPATMNAPNIIAIGSVYQTKGATLANNMKVCIGKIKVFGFNKNTKSWEIIQENEHPAGFALYDLPWTSNVSHKLPCDTYDDHIAVSVSASDLHSRVLHFWGNSVPFDKTKYSYYATAYTFWAEGANANSLTAVNAMDLKSGPKGTVTVGQVNSSRGLAVTSSRKTVWSTTIPNSEYKAEWGTQLQALFDK